MDGRLMTPEEVAAALAVRPRAVLDWLRSGYLAGYKVGRLWRVSRAQLDDLIGRADRAGEGTRQPR